MQNHSSTSAAGERVGKRIDKYLKLLGDVEESYEKDHPEWQIEVLLWLMVWGVESLRIRLESDEKIGPTWDSPFIEIRFPVEFDWSGMGKGEIVSVSMTAGGLTAENTSTRSKAIKSNVRDISSAAGSHDAANVHERIGVRKERQPLHPNYPAETRQCAAYNKEQVAA
jgi:hypothetical protein